MPTIYEFSCEPCRAQGVLLADDEKKPGTLVIFLMANERDNARLCPKCKEPLTRASIPEGITTTWGNRYNKKKTCLGPSIDYYPPSRDRKRREANPKRHIHMGGEKSAELKREEQRAPSASEVPKPGAAPTRSE